jgi:hypothetical protein
MPSNCIHFDKKKGLQIEVHQERGKEPKFTCRLCKGEFNQSQVIEIVDNINEMNAK